MTSRVKSRVSCRVSLQVHHQPQRRLRASRHMTVTISSSKSAMHEIQRTMKTAEFSSLAVWCLKAVFSRISRRASKFKMTHESLRPHWQARKSKSLRVAAHRQSSEAMRTFTFSASSSLTFTNRAAASPTRTCQPAQYCLLSLQHPKLTASRKPFRVWIVGNGRITAVCGSLRVSARTSRPGCSSTVCFMLGVLGSWGCLVIANEDA